MIVIIVILVVKLVYNTDSGTKRENITSPAVPKILYPNGRINKQYQQHIIMYIRTSVVTALCNEKEVIPMAKY